MGEESRSCNFFLGSPFCTPSVASPARLFAQVSLRHAPAEETGEPANKYDLATICLVNHESPAWVSRAMFREAYRLLRTGGVFTILDLDKNNLAILLENPFVAAVYKQVRAPHDTRTHSAHRNDKKK